MANPTLYRILMNASKSKTKGAVKTGPLRSLLLLVKSWRFWLKITLVVLLVSSCVLVYLDAWVRYKFEGKKWALPGKVYSRALDIYVGLDLKETAFKQELESLGYRAGRKLAGPGTYVSNGQGRYMVHSRGFQFWDSREPARRFFVSFNQNQISLLSSVEGAELNIVRLEPLQIGGIYPKNYEDRQLVLLQAVPANLLAALIAVEDKSFYQHHGISFRAILRALKANISAGAVRQGGSTLTQQLVKNFYLTKERNLARKAVEAVMALLLELHYEKDAILEAYINEIFLGQAGRRAVHGFGLGSQHYFRRPLAELKLHQVALLVGMIKGPSYYDPWKHPERALRRRNLVLDIMSTEQVLPADTIAIARRRPLDIAERRESLTTNFPGYMELVRQQLQQDYKDEDLRTEGLRIFTNLDPLIQAQSEKSLAESIQHIEQQWGEKASELQGAIVVTKTGTGEISAVVGGRDPRYAGFNRALHAVRPIGSLIKPVVYLTALKQSRQYSLASLISDEPVTVQGPDNELWQPNNFDRESHGDVLLYQAMAQSYNLATARLGMNIGIDNVLATVKKLGIDKKVPAVPAVLLGSIELSPFDVASMYQTIAAEGFFTPLRAIREVVDADGQPLTRYPLQIDQRFEREYIYLISYAMQAAVREGTGKSIYQSLPNHIPLAGKTGTTNDQRDSWFAGFDGQHLAVVWLGQDDNSTTPLTGATGALRVWRDLYSHIGVDAVSFFQPDGIVYKWVDESTGLLSKEMCQGAHYIPFIKGYGPERVAPCRRRAGSWLRNLF